VPLTFVFAETLRQLPRIEDASADWHRRTAGLCWRRSEMAAPAAPPAA
jgi:hypothetical protein